MKTPYEILGVAQNATDDEIKKAYKALVKKYHPDKYRDSDLADLATEKMKEINAAYEEIQKMRSGNGANQSGNSGSHSSSGSTSSNFWEVRRMINNNQIQQAEQILRATDSSMQNAEWNFLMGCVMYKRGFFMDAQTFFDRACSMEPHNREFAQARDQLRAQTAGYGSGYRTASSSDTACSCCSNLICADCCCEMMGGDLISCC